MTFIWRPSGSRLSGELSLILEKIVCFRRYDHRRQGIVAHHKKRFSLLGNLRSDPFERAEYEGYGYNQWVVEHMFAFAPAAFYVGQWLQSFREFPPRQKPGSFNLDRVMEALTQPHAGRN